VPVASKDHFPTSSRSYPAQSRSKLPAARREGPQPPDLIALARAVATTRDDAMPTNLLPIYATTLGAHA
jgi:hypothetical protein